MRWLGAFLVVGWLLAAGAAGFLVSNSRVGSSLVFERVPANRRPLNVLVDIEAVPGVANPLAVTQDLMNQWNAVNEAEAVFGTASAGGPYNGGTVGATFGTFTNTSYEVAWDDTGEILAHFGVGPTVLGITLKSVDTGRGNILDFLVIVNTRPGLLVAPGTGATAEELFRATLLHELGHALGLGHSPVGLANPTTFGLVLAAPSQAPTMFPFRLPVAPQEGGTISGDDVAGLIDIYPDDVSGLGSLSGTVRAASGAPINEIAVRAVGPAGVGEQHVGVLTDADATGQGRFTIPNLPPGPYRVVVEAVNGRGSVTSFSLAGTGDGLGANAFLFAADELWQPGDGFDPQGDDPQDFAFVHVRAGRDTGSIDFVLNAAPLPGGAPEAGSLADGDAQIPDGGGGFHFVDYFVFTGTAGANATINATAAGFVPQLQLLRPSDLGVEAEHLPNLGAQANLQLSLPQDGIWTVALSARATTGNPGGEGTYTLTLGGTGGALPAPPVVVPAVARRGPLDPGVQELGSPLCSTTLLQIRLDAPSHEELWVDALRVRAAGSAHDSLDVDRVSVVHDRNGNGRADGGEPVLATGAFTTDDGTLTLGNLGLEIDPGLTEDLLVVYDVTVESVSSTSGPFAWWAALLLLPLLLLRRRAVLLVLLLAASLPLSCGGGGGGCNGAFNPAGAVVTFEVTIDAGGLTAFTPTTDPGTPLTLPATPLASGTLSVSN